MSKPFLFVVLSAALIFTGCVSSSDQILYTPPALSDDWTVNMIQTGGIMGMKRSILVSSDGKYQVLDQRTQKSANGTLTESQRNEVKGSLTGLKFTAPNLPSACADCFIYNIEIESNGQKMKIQLDDTTLPGSGFEPLVGSLTALMDSALK